jgi:hypothetical protein
MLEAGFWGLVGGSALILGALIAYFATLPQRANRGGRLPAGVRADQVGMSALRKDDRAEISR